MQSGGDLSAVDALLGCPIHMLPDPAESDSDAGGGSGLGRTAARVLLDFYVANWLVEVLGAFAGQADLEMRAKAVRRANQLWALLDRLDIALLRPAAADFPLPDLCAASEADATRPPGYRAAMSVGVAGRSSGRAAGKENAKPDAAKASGGKGGKGRKGGKKKKGAEAMTCEDVGAAGSDDPIPSPADPEGGAGASSAGTKSSGGSAVTAFQGKTRVQQAAAAGFATDLAGVRARLGCFRELGPTVLLVRPVLQVAASSNLEREHNLPNWLAQILADSCVQRVE